MSEKKIIVHCSASEFGHAIMIDGWHREKGWKSIGYHYVIMNGYPTKQHLPGEIRPEGMQARILNGGIEIGRTLDADDDIETWEMGAHAYGYNAETVAVCLIGDKTFTRNQIVSLVELIKLIQFQFHVPTSLVVGHCELPGVEKSCPNLNMDQLRELVMNKSKGIKLLRSFENVTG